MSFFEFCVMFCLLWYFIVFIKIALKVPLREPRANHILKYCFEYNIERYYSIAYVSFCAGLLLGFIGYLRLTNLDKTINLLEIFKTLKMLYFQLPFIIIIFNIVLFFSFLYLFILCIKVFKIFFNKELVKLHFYYFDKEPYRKIHFAILSKYSLDSLVVGNIRRALSDFYDYLALGYKKKVWLYTKEERIITRNFEDKFYFYEIIRIVKFFFFHLHYICLFIILFYDLRYNNYTLLYVFKYLPIMLLYQIYIAITTFVVQKPSVGICAEANMFFYHDIKYVDNRAMFVNGELREIPKTFPEDFLEYEASGFTDGYGISKKKQLPK